MARMSGADLAVEVSTNGTTWTSFGCFRSFNLNARKDRIDATCASDTNKTYKLGKPDFTVSGQFVFDDSNVAVFTAAEGTSAVTLRACPNKTVSGHNWKGSFWVDYTIESSYDGMVLGTIELAADGAVTRTTTTA